MSEMDNRWWRCYNGLLVGNGAPERQALNVRIRLIEILKTGNLQQLKDKG